MRNKSVCYRGQPRLSLPALYVVGIYQPGPFPRNRTARQSAGVYDGDDADYYGQVPYAPPEQSADSRVARAQEQLARRGYYRGEIDGIFGPGTRRAVMRYQSDHGLRVTGRLNPEMLHALGLPQVASN